MSRVQTIVQLPQEMIDALDVEAQRRGESRSALIREAVAEHLQHVSRAAAIEQYVEGYRRRPAGEVDDWGDLGADADRAGRLVAQRLDDEERAQGLEW